VRGREDIGKAGGKEDGLEGLSEVNFYLETKLRIRHP